MATLKWTTQDAVWITDIDDQHQEIFDAVANLSEVLAHPASLAEIRKAVERLTARAAGHFDHEERLMNAARYASLGWHKRQHDAARKRVQEFAGNLDQNGGKGGVALVEWLWEWLPNHARVTDRMMGAFLRNHRRFIGKVVMQAGTRPLDSCPWVDSEGEAFEPKTTPTRL